MDALLQQLPLLHDGAEEGFHQGRVAIRRAREAVSLADGGSSEQALADIDERLTRAFKALGRVRDADSGLRLVERLLARLPFATLTLGRLRNELQAETIASRRKALKRIESLDLASLPDHLKAALRRASLPKDWRTALRHQIAARASGARSAIEHATGVYFPNRVHGARVALKQLRYTLELGRDTNVWRRRGALRLLKQAQETLGSAHDLEVLKERLADHESGDAAARTEIGAITQFMQAELADLHAAYVGLRPQLVELCEECERVPRRPITAGQVLLMAGAAVPPLLLLRRRAG